MRRIRNSVLSPRWTTFLKNWLVGVNQPIPFAGLALLPRYFKSWYEFIRSAPNTSVPILDTYPCLTDVHANTPFDPHYFHQAAWLSRRLQAARPDLHVDVGSSVMAIGILSGFFETIFVDYRPLNTRRSGLSPVGADITALPFASDSISSLSCLHVIEHIGLGRYGDPLDVNGSHKAASELARVTRPSGRVYLSTPVGRERVCFNAHRVFSPKTVLEMVYPLRVISFAVVTDDGQYLADASPADAAHLEYGCGLFELTK